MKKNQLEIVPAILEKKWSTIESKMARVSGLVSHVQVDIADGVFVPSKIYASSGRSDSLQKIVTRAKKHKLQVVFDLMVDLKSEQSIARWANSLRAAKPDRAIFHMGSTKDWGSLFAKLAGSNKKIPFDCGLAVHLQHKNSEIKNVFDQYPFSYFQVMGIEKVGYSGQKFSKKTLAKVAQLRKMYPQVDIAIDGGVKLENAAALKKAGATRLGVNSGLFKAADLHETLQVFKNA